MSEGKVIAVRMRPYNGREFKMRSYTSARGKRFTAGWGHRPSPWRIDITRQDVEELANVPQFEIRKFDDMTQLEGMIDAEMQDRARAGQPAIRAAIDGVKRGGKAEAAPRRDFGTIVTSTSDLDGEEAAAQVRPAPSPAPSPATGEATKGDLLAIAEGLGLDVHRRMKKEEIAAAIEAAKTSASDE